MPSVGLNLRVGEPTKQVEFAQLSNVHLADGEGLRSKRHRDGLGNFFGVAKN